VKEENNALRGQTYDALEQMRNYQHQVIGEILRKQETLVLEYDKRLKKKEKENRSLNKRVVQQRHTMINRHLGQV
jgi:hypothetical protein